jgi:tetratricopeptide (TPR) repeat protein
MHISAHYLSKCLRVSMLDSERQYDELIAALTNVLDQEPPHVIALNNRGGEALQDYSTAIQIELDNQYFRRSRAGLLHRLGQFAEAIADYDVAIEIEPEFQRTRDLRERAQAQVEPD